MKHTMFILRKKITLLYILFLTTLSVISQTHNEHVTIIGTFEPGLRPAQKISLKPEHSVPSIQITDTLLRDIHSTVAVTTTVSSQSPLMIQPKENLTPYHSYLKAGMGSLASPVFLFTHHSNIGKQTAFKTSVEHLSSWINVKDYAPSDWMKNRFSTGINQGFTNYFLSTELFYKRNHHRYYGFKPDNFPDQTGFKDQIGQFYQHYGLNALLQSTYRDPNTIKHEIDFTYSRFIDRNKSFENGFETKVKGRKNLSLFRLDNKQNLGLELRSSAYHHGDSVRNQTDFFLSLLPRLELSGSFYSIGAALRIEYQNTPKGNMSLYPNLWGKLLVLEQQLEFYAVLDGGNERQNISSIIDYNPFVHSRTQSWWENILLRFESGVKTNLIQNLAVHIGIRYDEINNKGFFVTDTATSFSNQFQVEFDHVKRMQFISELSYKLSNKWMANAVLLHQQYTLDGLAYAWHEPGLIVDVNLGHSWNEKLYVKAGLYFESKRYAPVFIQGVETIYNLKPVWDLNIEGNYNLNEQLNLFAGLNNLLHQRYERYYNYPVQGIQLFAGITIRF